MDSSDFNTIETASNNDASDNHVEENIKYLNSSTNRNTFLNSISIIHITIIVVCVHPSL